MKKAIILCSGGIDSVTTAYYIKKSLNYKNLIILFFDYGQRILKQMAKKMLLFIYLNHSRKVLKMVCINTEQQ